MNRFIEIVSNELILKKSKLEQELEDTINNKSDDDVQTRVDKTVDLLNQIGNVSTAYVTFDSYINKNNKTQDGTN